MKIIPLILFKEDSLYKYKSKREAIFAAIIVEPKHYGCSCLTQWNVKQ